MRGPAGGELLGVRWDVELSARTGRPGTPPNGASPARRAGSGCRSARELASATTCV